MSEIQDRHQQLCQLLDKEYNKELLQERWLPLVAPVLKQSGEYLQQEGMGQYLPKNLQQPEVRLKADIVRLVALLFADLETYHCFRENLPPEGLTLWDALVLRDVISFKQAREEYGVEVLSRDNKSGRYFSVYSTIKDSLSALPFKKPGWTSYADEHYFQLSGSLRQILLSYYEQPEWSQLSPMASPPATGIAYEQAEEAFHFDFPRLYAYYKQGEIGYTSKSRPSVSGLGKVHRMLKVREFFPDTDIRRHRLLRTHILASICPYLPSAADEDVAVHRLLRLFFKITYPTVFPSATALLPDIKGMGYLENRDFRPMGTQLLDLLKELPADSYVPVKNIEGYYTFTGASLEPVSRSEAYYRLSYDTSDKGLQKESVINFSYYRDAVQLPVLRGTFFMFAALGMCDLVYEQMAPEQMGVIGFSAWDGLLAVKRTRLGDYICGLTDHYQPSNKVTTGISLSEEALLIKLDSADSPFAGSLSPYAEQVGPLTFRTDARIFLQQVQRREQLIAKIDLFKNLVPGDIPANWQSFFSSLHEKINPLEVQQDCTIFKIPEGRQELLQLIAQDPVIKKLVAKAEGYLLIVPNKHLAELRRRLAEFGYMQS